MCTNERRTAVAATGRLPKLDVEVGEKKGTATDHRDAFRRTSSLWSSRHWIRGPDRQQSVCPCHSCRAAHAQLRGRQCLGCFDLRRRHQSTALAGRYPVGLVVGDEALAGDRRGQLGAAMPAHVAAPKSMRNSGSCQLAAMGLATMGLPASSPHARLRKPASRCTRASRWLGAVAALLPRRRSGPRAGRPAWTVRPSRSAARSTTAA